MPDAETELRRIIRGETPEYWESGRISEIIAYDWNYSDDEEDIPHFGGNINLSGVGSSERAKRGWASRRRK